MENAIKEGENTEVVRREEIFKILQRKPWILNLERVLKRI
jgi:hypothetical protein